MKRIWIVAGIVLAMLVGAALIVLGINLGDGSSLTDSQRIAAQQSTVGKQLAPFGYAAERRVDSGDFDSIPLVIFRCTPHAICDDKLWSDTVWVDLAKQEVVEVAGISSNEKPRRCAVPQGSRKLELFTEDPRNKDRTLQAPWQIPVWPGNSLEADYNGARWRCILR